MIARSGRAARRGVGTLAVAVLAVLAGCGVGDRPAAERLPNVLFVMFDTLRADRCSPYGYRLDTTPYLSTLASRGVLVRRAYAPMPTTAPSMATAVTSKEPRSHGLLANGQGLAPEQLTAAEILRDAGYTTAGFASSVALEPDGISQGFELYVDSWGDDEESKPPAYGLPDVHPSPSRRGEYTTAAALDWFAHRDRERPFFAFVHYYDPHEPYARPEAERAPFVGDRDPDDKFDALRIGYDAEVAYADRELAKLVGGLERAGELDDTLIVIWSDHGQGLYDHGWPGHDMQLYEESMHVPLILVWPGEIPAGRVLEAPVELQDLLPTVLGLIGLPVPEDAAFEGRDLTRAVLGIGRADDEHTLFFQRRPVSQSRKILGVLHDGPMWAVQVGRWKYIEAEREERFELYDLESDPGEKSNLYAERPEIAAELARRLRERVAGRDATPPASGDEISPERRKALEALGYVD